MVTMAHAARINLIVGMTVSAASAMDPLTPRPLLSLLLKPAPRAPPLPAPLLLPAHLDLMVWARVMATMAHAARINLIVGMIVLAVNVTALSTLRPPKLPPRLLPRHLLLLPVALPVPEARRGVTVRTVIVAPLAMIA